MQSRDLAFFGLYIVLGALVLFVGIFDPPAIITATVAVITAVSLPAANRVEEIHTRRSRRSKRREKVGDYVKRFNARTEELGLGRVQTDQVTDSYFQVDRELTKENVYEIAVSENFGSRPGYQQDIFHILILCREITVVDRPVEQARLKTRIDSIMTRFDLREFDSHTLEFLGAFEVAQKAIRSGSEPPEQILGQKPEDERNTALAFATEFGTTDQLSIVLFDDKERSEELRRTLGRLIARGKLSSKSVNRETAERIQEELIERGSDSTKFMLFSQKMHYSDAVQEAIEKYPHIRPSYKNPESGFPEVIEYMRIYVIYPEADFGTAKNFLEAEILPNIPDDAPEDGFIAAMPLRLEELEIYPEVREIEDFLTGTYEALNFLKTGATEDLSEIVSDRVMSEIGVSELLATIPFNVLEPDLSEDERETIISNYDELKQHFNVDTLFDWSDVPSDDLAQKLAELSGETGQERWDEIASSITGKAEEYSKAIYR